MEYDSGTIAGIVTGNDIIAYFMNRVNIFLRLIKLE
jgi:hypothetical protein